MHYETHFPVYYHLHHSGEKQCAISHHKVMGFVRFRMKPICTFLALPVHLIASGNKKIVHAYSI